MKTEIGYIFLIATLFLVGGIVIGWSITPQTINLDVNFQKCKELNGEYNLTHSFKNNVHYEYCEIAEIVRF